MNENWRCIIEYYKDRADHEPPMRPYLELAKKIAESEYAEDFFGCTSVGTLVISYRPDQSASRENARISIRYGGTGFFEITCSPKHFDTNLLEKHKCHRSQVFPLLESLFLRLELESGEREKS